MVCSREEVRITLERFTYFEPLARIVDGSSSPMFESLRNSRLLKPDLTQHTIGGKTPELEVAFPNSADIAEAVNQCTFLTPSSDRALLPCEKAEKI